MNHPRPLTLLLWFLLASQLLHVLEGTNRSVTPVSTRTFSPIWRVLLPSKAGQGPAVTALATGAALSDAEGEVGAEVEAAELAGLEAEAVATAQPAQAAAELAELKLEAAAAVQEAAALSDAHAAAKLAALEVEAAAAAVAAQVSQEAAALAQTEAEAAAALQAAQKAAELAQLEAEAATAAQSADTDLQLADGSLDAATALGLVDRLLDELLARFPRDEGLLLRAVQSAVTRRSRRPRLRPGPQAVVAGASLRRP